MHRSLLVFGIVVGLSGAMPILAGPVNESSPESLVIRLASDRYAERVLAAEQLRQCGSAALPALDYAAQFAEELDTRLHAESLAKSIRQTLDNNQRLAVEPIRLSYAGTPLATVLVDFQKRTGILVQLDPIRVQEPMRPIRLQTGLVSPWEALDAICEVAQLHEEIDADYNPRDLNPHIGKNRQRIAYSMAEQPRPAPGDLPILLVDGRQARQPGRRSGAVRVLALPGNFPAHRVIRGTGELLLHLDVTAIPKLHWQGVETVRIHRVTDDMGRELSLSHREEIPLGVDPNLAMGIPAVNRMFIDNTFGALPANTLQPNPRIVPVRLQIGDRTIRQLRQLEGVVVGEIVQTNQPLIQIDDLAAAQGATFEASADSRLTILSYAARAGGGTVLRLRADYPNPWSMQRLGLRGQVGGFGVLAPPFGGRISLGSWGHVQLTDAGGQAIRQVNVSNSQMTDDGIRQVYEVELTVPTSSAVPSRLLLIGNKTVRLEVPFRLADVACP